MNIRINDKLKIPENEIKWRFSRSSGAGGQNINKTESRAEVLFNVFNSKTLTPYQKHKISNQSQANLIKGCICIAVQDKRTQYQNKQLALHRLVLILRDFLKPSLKKRRQTIPTRSSQRKRVDSKKKRGELKRNRKSKIDYY